MTWEKENKKNKTVPTALIPVATRNGGQERSDLFFKCGPIFANAENALAINLWSERSEPRVGCRVRKDGRRMKRIKGEKRRNNKTTNSKSQDEK